MQRADTMVEYGPVQIGGKNYICPLRSVSISRGPSSLSFDRAGKQILGPPATMLNDVTFSDYHVFRSQARIVSGPVDPAANAK